MSNPDTTENQPYLVWDTCDIAQAQAAFLVESGLAKDEEDGFAQACADSDLFTFEWDNLLEELNDLLQEINPDGYWHAEVSNFGWRNLSGYNDFRAQDGKSFLQKILPETECTFRLFREKDDTLRIQNFHHDSPTGNEWYTLQPVTAEDFELAA